MRHKRHYGIIKFGSAPGTSPAILTRGSGLHSLTPPPAMAAKRRSGLRRMERHEPFCAHHVRNPIQTCRIPCGITGHLISSTNTSAKTVRCSGCAQASVHGPAPSQCLEACPATEPPSFSTQRIVDSAGSLASAAATALTGCPFTAPGHTAPTLSGFLVHGSRHPRGLTCAIKSCPTAAHFGHQGRHKCTAEIAPTNSRALGL